LLLIQFPGRLIVAAALAFAGWLWWSAHTVIGVLMALVLFVLAIRMFSTRT
jgi:hypothetical protein